jgi:hydroxymethylbilane synthase
MRIKIAARQSDLARLQAYRVGEALVAAKPDIKIDYLFSTSLGDQNQTDPLWQMPEKGVFTQDLTLKLIAGECDMVVHSWKDLPTEDREETVIAATLPRADARDVLLVKKSALVDLAKGDKILKIFSSSPRRQYNLSRILPELLPFSPQLEFLPVRGNIQTRVKKLLAKDSPAQGLVVAKAALDRLILSHEDEFLPTRLHLQSALKDCCWMVLPAFENPPAPAQGALAIEVLKSRADLQSFLRQINCNITFENVLKERETLKKYGGGCHQKIGVYSAKYSFGDVHVVRGQTPAGEKIQVTDVQSKQAHVFKRSGFVAPKSISEIFPVQMADAIFYQRKMRKVELQQLFGRDLWVARADAWPQDYRATQDQVVWASGLRTWRKLAKLGVWVNGSQEGLGESANPNQDLQLNALARRALQFVKLSHSEAEGLSALPLVQTYDLEELNELPDLSNKSYFFWASYSQFARALKAYPQIKRAYHACGPGHSYTLIKKALGESAALDIYLNYQSWLEAMTQKD